MISFIKIDKNGQQFEETLDNIDNLYKKCGLRKSDGFNIIYESEFNEYQLQLWCRNSGRLNQKNQYIFPLQKDLLIYGTAALLLTHNKKNILTYDKTYTNLTVHLLDTIINKNNNKEIINLETNNLETNNLETNNLETNNLETNNLETNNLETNNFETNNFETNNKEIINNVMDPYDSEPESESDSDLILEDYMYSSDEYNN
jgi:hypothetical protein